MIYELDPNRNDGMKFVVKISERYMTAHQGWLVRDCEAELKDSGLDIIMDNSICVYFKHEEDAIWFHLKWS